MNKNFRLSIIFLLVIAAFYFAQNDQLFTSADCDYTTVISTSRKWAPGKGENLLVYVFEKSDEGIKFVKDLELHATISHVRSQLHSSMHVRFKHLSEGVYSSLVEIPPDWGTGHAQVKIWGGSGKKILLNEFTIETGRELALMVLPPEDSIFAGNWVNFSFSVIDCKNGQGAFKIPVRVKLATPSGNVTVNRVITTDLNGNGLFTTHFNNHAPEGIYKFEFTYAKQTQQFEIWVGSHEQRNLLVSEQIKSLIGDLLPVSSMLKTATGTHARSPSRFSLKTSLFEEADALNSISIEKHSAMLNYSYPGSEYRQIELWQNGRTVYTSDLPLESGRISIPLHLPLQNELPAVFKLWAVKNGQVFVYEQVMPPKSPSDKVLKEALQSLESLFTYKVEAQNFFMTLVGETTLTKTRGLSIASTTPNIAAEKILMRRTPLKSQENHNPFRGLINHSDTELRKQANKRFFIVDTELRSARYRFNTLRIWHDPGKFFTSLLIPLLAGGFDIVHIATEAELRVLRFPYLRLNEQSAELEKLEGLLIPLSEFFVRNPDYIKTPEDSKLLSRAILRLGTLIRLPEKLRNFVKAENVSLDMIGPISPLFPDEIPVKKLIMALQSGGKATIFTPGRNINLNLTGMLTTYDLKTSPAMGRHMEKLVNGRTIPLVVELDFSTD